MATIQRLDNSISSNVGSGGTNSGSGHRLNSKLDKSSSFRDGHESRVVVVGTSGGGGKLQGTGPSGGGGFYWDLQPLSTVLSLDLLSAFGDPKAGRHLELSRAINAATGGGSDDPALGSVPSKSLEACGPEDLRRVKHSLHENAKSARDWVDHLNEAVQKLDKFQNFQSKKRSRSESGVSHERPVAVVSAERLGASHAKSSASAALSHVSNPDTSGSQKAGEKNKSVVPNKRVRTSMADVRPEGRPSNLSVQRSSGIQERGERDTSRPSSSLASPVEEKERTALASGDGLGNSKLKGRRSSVKSDASPSVTNGTLDSEREHKWNPQYRSSFDSRSRPSECHGIRSGPVQGFTSIQKAEAAAQMNGSNVRGSSKGDSDAAPPSTERGDRYSAPERERPLSKNGVKPSSREDSQLGTSIITKAKAARAPRSSSVTTTNPSVHSSRTSNIAETRERLPATAPAKTQPSIGPSNRKRPAPSGSSSPPGPPAQWGSQRPKMARGARRVISVPSRDDSSAVVEPGGLSKEGNGIPPTPVARSTTPGATSVSGLARRVTLSGTHSVVPKVRVEKPAQSAGVSGSEESEEDAEKAKEKVKKTGTEPGDNRPAASSVKMGSIVSPAKKTHVVPREVVLQGDGVRRQGRTGRGAVTPRATPVIRPPPEKVEISPGANAKQLRSARATVDIKPDRPGRPPTKKGTIDRKPATRPRRLPGNGSVELSGESDDDREEITKAVELAVNFSASACSSVFWKQVEPYFAYITAANMDFLHQQTKELDVEDTALRIPPCGEQLSKVDQLRNCRTPPLSPNLDVGGKSMCSANGNIECDGGSTTKLFNSFKDRHDIGRGGRRGVSGTWFDKIFPLSQRLLSALINEREVDDRQKLSEKACRDQPFAETQVPESGSPFRPSSQTESERMDPEGESDCEPDRRDSDRWSCGVGEQGYCEATGLFNGQINLPGFGLGKGDDIGGDDIMANVDGDCGERSDYGIRDEPVFSSRDDLRGLGTGTELTAWELQYQRMSIDDRLCVELQSIGLLPELAPDPSQREDHEICEELRKLQQELKEQVSANKFRLSCIEAAVLAKKETEERVRERLAMDKFVETAYTKRMGSRGTSGSKGAAAKAARAAALVFAKRVVAKVTSFEAGHSCIVDPALQNVLFCVTPKVVESTTGALNVVENEIGAAGARSPPLGIEDPASIASLSLKASGSSLLGGTERPSARRSEGREKIDRISLEARSPLGASSQRTKAKEAWPVRVKEREILLEDVADPQSMRDVKSLGMNCLGGTKGKRSERDREGKGGQSKEGGHYRGAENTKLAAHIGGPSLGSIKGERKTKTKPRQKIGPLLKTVNGLLANSPAEQPSSRDRASMQTVSWQQTRTETLNSFQQEKVSVLPVSNVLQGHSGVDLSQLPLSEMEDMVAVDMGNHGQDGLGNHGQDDMGNHGQDDISSWFDFDIPAEPADDGLLMGLDVPMDDLSDLTLMM